MSGIGCGGYSLRSSLLAQRAHPKVVLERLGLATIAVTLDTYSHVLPGLQEAAAQRFEEVLARQGANSPR